MVAVVVLEGGGRRAAEVVVVVVLVARIGRPAPSYPFVCVCMRERECVCEALHRRLDIPARSDTTRTRAHSASPRLSAPCHLMVAIHHKLNSAGHYFSARPGLHSRLATLAPSAKIVARRSLISFLPSSLLLLSFYFKPSLPIHCS